LGKDRDNVDREGQKKGSKDAELVEDDLRGMGIFLGKGGRKEYRNQRSTGGAKIDLMEHATGDERGARYFN